MSCTKCKNPLGKELTPKARDAKFFGEFHRKHEPVEFFEGDPNSPIWIIGLNPKTEDGIKNATKELLIHHLTKEKKDEQYFKRFNSVLPAIFNNLGVQNGVGHTDIVKCSSENFDFPESDKVAKICSEILKKQIEIHKPKIIICNGSKVSKYMLENFWPNNTTHNTTYTKYDYFYADSDEKTNNYLTVFLSGFLSQVDNYAKARLGNEIAETIANRQIALPSA